MCPRTREEEEEWGALRGVGMVMMPPPPSLVWWA
jgi:hypothetical protein